MSRTKGSVTLSLVALTMGFTRVPSSGMSRTTTSVSSVKYLKPYMDDSAPEALELVKSLEDP